VPVKKKKKTTPPAHRHRRDGSCGLQHDRGRFARTARIVRVVRCFLLHDLDSRNGRFVNARALRQELLREVTPSASAHPIDLRALATTRRAGDDSNTTKSDSFKSSLELNVNDLVRRAGFGGAATANGSTRLRGINVLRSSATKRRCSIKSPPAARIHPAGPHIIFIRGRAHRPGVRHRRFQAHDATHTARFRDQDYAHQKIRTNRKQSSRPTRMQGRTV